MSAECHDCGADLVYPSGSWPQGECPQCRLRLAEEVVRAARAYRAISLADPTSLDRPPAGAALDRALARFAALREPVVGSQPDTREEQRQ